MKLRPEQMQSLPEFFKTITDPRRRQGRRHALPTVLAIATAAVLCGARGYKAIADWAQALSPRARVPGFVVATAIGNIGCPHRASCAMC